MPVNRYSSFQTCTLFGFGQEILLIFIFLAELCSDWWVKRSVFQNYLERSVKHDLSTPLCGICVCLIFDMFGNRLVWNVEPGLE